MQLITVETREIFAEIRSRYTLFHSNVYFRGALRINR